ncbi:hypothetical protein JTB14_009444 [Gonioctena quinquepunctata]|nr:hypothetical protein JTB14_009444 [Gonioctena quinquepunctata]
MCLTFLLDLYARQTRSTKSVDKTRTFKWPNTVFVESRVCTIPNMRILVLLVFLGGVFVDADDAQQYGSEYYIYRDAFDFVKGCGNKELSLCLKVNYFQ